LLDTISKLDLRDVLRNVSLAKQSALVLDYDGTLAPFRVNRAEAVPYEGVSPLLQAIMASGRCRVVLVTGRRADEVIPLLGLTPHPEIWGIHGLERLHTDGSHEMTSLDPDILDALAAAADWVNSLGLHRLAEPKPGSLAVHWRGLAREKAQVIRNRVLLGWLSIADGACLNVEEFDGGIEFRVAHRNKGDAVRTILSELEIHTPIAYLGDDQTDEDAFRALHDRGLCVLVRPQRRETVPRVNYWRSFANGWRPAFAHLLAAHMNLGRTTATLIRQTDDVFGECELPVAPSLPKSIRRNAGNRLFDNILLVCSIGRMECLRRPAVNENPCMPSKGPCNAAY
jgi:trehalose-phosphatase